MSNWQHIPRKLRAGLVQLNGNLTITVSKDTEHELRRRGWIEDGQIKRFNRNTGLHGLEWGIRLTFEGKKVFEARGS